MNSNRYIITVSLFTTNGVGGKREKTSKYRTSYVIVMKYYNYNLVIIFFIITDNSKLIFNLKFTSITVPTTQNASNVLAMSKHIYKRKATEFGSILGLPYKYQRFGAKSPKSEV